MRTAAFLLISVFCMAQAQLDMSSDKMDFEDNIAEESQSQSNEHIFTNSIAPKPILNDGKPFYVARDPTTGTLDFNIKKTVGIQNDIPVTRKDELSGSSKSGHDINSLGHNNFHDYLNLPVKYTSSKFVYPLISGSYANLKYQGNNKNHESNHKNYTNLNTSTPKYYTHITNQVNNIFTATFKHPDTTHGPVVRITTRRPTTTKSTTTERPTTVTTTERTTTTQSTTPAVTTSPITTQSSSSVKYSSTIVQNSFPSTFKNKYIDSSETRKKTTMATTSTKPSESSTSPPANPIKFLDDLLEKVEKKETKATTYRPHTDNTRLSFSTSMPLLPSAFKPMPTEAQRNNSQKIVFETGSKNPSVMTLSEIINSFQGNDELSNEENSIPYETPDHSNSEVTNSPPPANAPQKETQHKTLQQQMQENQQQIKQQNNDSPVHDHPNYSAPSHVDFPSDQFEDYVEFENPQDHQYANQYVKYEVQKPNTNLVKFQQIPSMNNVVISPGQNSASFVLGSQQSVGSVGIGSSLGVGSSHFTDNNRPMKVGQVINDEPPMRSQSSINSNQIQGSIRFPSDSEQQFGNAQIVKGTIKMDGSAETVQPPQALSRDQPPSETPLVFPSNEHNLGPDVMNAELSYAQPTPTNPSQIIFENVNDIYGKINDKKQKQEIASNNAIAGDLTPPRILTPPSPSPNRPFNKQQFNIRRPVQQRIPGLPNILPQFRPNAKASQGHPMLYKDVGAIRIPMQGQGPYNRQYASPVSLPKVGLPPMLPPHSQNQNYRRLQNRPYGSRTNGPHQHPAYDQINDTGNRRILHLPQQQINQQQINDRPQTQQQQFINDRSHQQQQHFSNGRPNQQQFLNDRPHQQQFNDRSQQQLNDRVFMRPPPLSPPSFQLKRPQQSGAPETMQMQQRPSNIPQSPPDSELNKSSPPPPVQQHHVPELIENYHDSNNSNLEPVVTLQMLQNKKNGNKLNNLPPVPHDIPQDIQAPIPSNHKEETSKTPSIYVVYPVSASPYENGAPSQGDIEQQSGDYQIPGVSEYQNTPFSVVSHFEQEPLLPKKDKKKSPFPYHLERPASTEFKFERPKYGPPHDVALYNLGEQPTSSRVVNKRPPFAEHPDAAISSTLTRVTEKPIAIAYTPTEPNRNYPPVTNYYQTLHPSHQYLHHYDPHLSGDKFSVPNYGGPVISEILDEKQVGFDYFHRQQQLQQHLNNGEDLDFYKEHYDFQAPFQASVSLSPEVTNPFEGWSIVTQSTDTNKIDRADLHLVESSEETTTRKFDPNEFQPVFESGFQPIYSGSKVSTAPELILESSEHPTTLALTYSTQPIDLSTPSSYSSSSTSSESSQEPTLSEETTTKKIEKKKEIDSLEAFFESLTRDYDEEESESKSENESKNRRSL